MCTNKRSTSNVLRHTVVEGKREATIGFKSARKKLAFGIGKAGRPPSEGTIYERLATLEGKGCIKVLSSEHLGTRLQIVLPSEMPDLIPLATDVSQVDLEDLDFFSVLENRKLILEREEWRCFYCLAKLDENNQVIDHVLSRPEGDSSFRNVVAACRRCNNRKSATPAEDFLRTLYREGSLSGEELSSRIKVLGQLRVGELRPVLR